MNDRELINDLVKLLSSTQSDKEMEQLLEAILTPDEYNQIQKRVQIIKLLLVQKTHREVAKELDISTAKVGRGSRELKYGSGIFQKLFKRL